MVEDKIFLLKFSLFFSLFIWLYTSYELLTTNISSFFKIEGLSLSAIPYRNLRKHKNTNVKTTLRKEGRVGFADPWQTEEEFGKLIWKQLLVYISTLWG